MRGMFSSIIFAVYIYLSYLGVVKIYPSQPKQYDCVEVSIAHGSRDSHSGEIHIWLRLEATHNEGFWARLNSFMGAARVLTPEKRAFLDLSNDDVHILDDELRQMADGGTNAVLLLDGGDIQFKGSEKCVTVHIHDQKRDLSAKEIEALKTTIRTFQEQYEPIKISTVQDFRPGIVGDETLVRLEATQTQSIPDREQPDPPTNADKATAPPKPITVDLSPKTVSALEGQLMIWKKDEAKEDAIVIVNESDTRVGTSHLSDGTNGTLTIYIKDQKLVLYGKEIDGFRDNLRDQREAAEQKARKK